MTDLQGLEISLTIRTLFFFPTPVSNIFSLSLSPSPPLWNSSLVFLPFLISVRVFFFFCTRGWNAWRNASCLGRSSSFNENVSI